MTNTSKSLCCGETVILRSYPTLLLARDVAFCPTCGTTYSARVESVPPKENSREHTK